MPPSTVSNAAVEGASKEEDELIIEKENSAWDVLEERFKKNALEGKYLDLTDDTTNGGRVLSVSDAAAAFSAMKQSSGEISMGATMENLCDGGNSSSELNGDATNGLSGNATYLGFLIQLTVSDLKYAREHLVKVMQDECRSSDSLKRLLKIIGRRTRDIQKYVDNNSNFAVELPSAIDKVERMNLLVMKANALITACNEKTRNEIKVTLVSARGKKRQKGDGGAGSNGVIVID